MNTLPHLEWLTKRHRSLSSLTKTAKRFCKMTTLCMRSEGKIGEVKAELYNTSRRIFALRMVSEHAFPRRTEKPCLARAVLNSFPRQTAAPAATCSRSCFAAECFRRWYCIEQRTEMHASDADKYRLVCVFWPLLDLHEGIRSLYFSYMKMRDR